MNLLNFSALFLFSFSMGIMGLNESFVLLMVSSRKGNFSLHHQKKNASGAFRTMSTTLQYC